MPPRTNVARPLSEDVPSYDFTGRPLRLVKRPRQGLDEPSPLVEAIVKYLDGLR